MTKGGFEFEAYHIFIIVTTILGGWNFEGPERELKGISFNTHNSYFAPAYPLTILDKFYVIFVFEVGNGILKIQCVNPDCDQFVHRDEILARLSGSVKDK